MEAALCPGQQPLESKFTPNPPHTPPSMQGRRWIWVEAVDLRMEEW